MSERPSRKNLGYACPRYFPVLRGLKPYSSFLYTTDFRGGITMVRILFLLLSILFLSSTNVIADDQHLTPIAALIDKAKTALAQHDEKTFDRLTDRIFERITGFSASASPAPEDVSDDEYIQRMCSYDRLTERIYTLEHFNVVRHQMALTAYLVVREDKENDVTIRAMTECISDDGRPTIRAQFMRDGIAWIKTFQAANTEQALSMAQDIEALAANHPNTTQLATLANLVRYDARQKQKADRSKTDYDERRVNELTYQTDFIEKAHYGDLDAQLEVARRLETGDKFDQNNRFAYFWYKRALQNGGGETAQTALDRLAPQLDWFDLELVDMWLSKNHRPY